MFDDIPILADVTPLYNVGALLDITTGTFHKTTEGGYILNGGMGYLTSIAGPPNSFKSELINYLYFKVFGVSPDTLGLIYDTENSMSYERLNRSIRMNPKFADADIRDPEFKSRLKVSRGADILGDVWFEFVKKGSKERKKISGKLTKKTPFLDNRGATVETTPPVPVMIDSLTEFKVTSIQEGIVEKNNTGESGNNIVFMRDGAAKTIMQSQLTSLAVNGGLMFFLVAHIGNKIEINQYGPPEVRLSHSRRGVALKGVPGRFKYINNLLLEIENAYILTNSSQDKSSKYPKSELDKDVNADLMLIDLTITRNKSGSSGIPIEIVVSQEDGVLPSLTQFHYLKRCDNYGISGSNISYNLDLYPDVNLSRTKVRSKLDEDAKLARAVHFTSEMCQMQHLWRSLPEAWRADPKSVYENIKKQGYDWDVLLSTESQWRFVDDLEKDAAPYMSTACLLDMAAGLYKPSWYDAFAKVLAKQKEKAQG